MSPRAHYEGEWHPCTILSTHPDGAATVRIPMAKNGRAYWVTARVAAGEWMAS